MIQGREDVCCSIKIRKGIIMSAMIDELQPLKTTKNMHPTFQ